MTYQERILRLTDEAVDGIVRNVRAVPEDRLNWLPEPTARSAVDIFQECAAAPAFFARMMRERRTEPMTPESMQKMREARQAWKTLDEIEAVLRKSTEDLKAAVLAVPEADLDVDITMPWGATASLGDVMSYHYWNLTYHLGQLAYIQRLYGDVEMH